MHGYLGSGKEPDPIHLMEDGKVRSIYGVSPVHITHCQELVQPRCYYIAAVSSRVSSQHVVFVHIVTILNNQGGKTVSK